MPNRIICIGREFGSGGHEIAIRTAAQLGIRVYEKELLLLACKFGEVSRRTLEKADEKPANPYLYQAVCEGNRHVIRGLPTAEVLFSLQSQEIRRLAQREDCVFVGRCADFILGSEDVRLLRVFVKAPLEYRMRRKMELEELTPSKALRLIQKTDRQRRKYYESFTGRAWGDPRFHDLVIDSSLTGIEGAAEQIAARYQSL